MPWWGRVTAVTLAFKRGNEVQGFDCLSCPHLFLSGLSELWRLEAGGRQRPVIAAGGEGGGTGRGSGGACSRSRRANAPEIAVVNGINFDVALGRGLLHPQQPVPLSWRSPRSLRPLIAARDSLQ